MNSNKLRVSEIMDINDGLLLPWLDLYETAFPPGERVLVSLLLDLLKSKMRGFNQERQLLTASDEKHELVGMAMYELVCEAETAMLRYMAITADQRNLGLGTSLYQEVLRRIEPVAKALLVEVESPDEFETEAGRQLAHRRIQFYRRHGAFLLRGIRYIQHVGSHQPPIPMYVMVHPFQSINPQTAFELARAVFADSITRVGTLTLE
jgi:GNAT superfamily N-acetyltransferase